MGKPLLDAQRLEQLAWQRLHGVPEEEILPEEETPPEETHMELQLVL